MPIHSTTSTFSDAIIRVDEICDAANALPEDARRLMLAALRERSPRYCWAIDCSGRLTCRHDACPVNPPQLRQWASEEAH